MAAGRRPVAAGVTLLAACAVLASATATPLEQARERGRRFERAIAAMDRVRSMRRR